MQKGEGITSTPLDKLLKGKHPLKRKTMGIEALDDIIGGGFVKGQTLLLAGEPGIGKSTLALQIASTSKLKTLYVSGEETVSQIAERARRITKDSNTIEISYCTDTDMVTQYMSNSKFQLVIIDSIQTMATQDTAGFLGSLAQVRESSSRLVNTAKKSGQILLILGQVTKTGAIAGPKTLEHIVDTVIYLEGERGGSLRIARCKKNRFGKSGTISVFKMTQSGLKEVKETSSAFLHPDAKPQIGVARTVALEGQLPLGIEIQSLSSFSAFSLPRRVSRGIDINKLLLILGIIEKHSRISFSKQDVYINIAGGISVRETGIDLAIAASLISSSLNKPLHPNTFYIGELELSGRIRTPTENNERIKIAVKSGAKKIFTAKLSQKTKLEKKAHVPQYINVIELTDIKDLLRIIKSEMETTTAKTKSTFQKT